MGMRDALGTLGPLGEAQWGMLTSRQAVALGVAQRDLVRLEQAGALERVAHGVYLAAAAPRPLLLELKAAWMQLAPGVPIDQRVAVQGVISHASAVAAHALGTLDPIGHEFTFPSNRRFRTRRADLVLHQADLSAADVNWVDQMLVTAVPRTIADLAVSAVDGGHLAEILDDALRLGALSRRAAAQALAPSLGRYGLPANLDEDELLGAFLDLGGR
jgi:predicted transcriptional regulator of viral defense system